MAGLAQKEKTVEKLKAEMAKATVAVVADYRGLSMAEMTELRRELLKENARMAVVKNTLMRRIISGTVLEGITAHLKGPTAIAYGTADQVKPVKIIKEFLKKNKKTNEIRGGYLDGKVLSAKEVQQVADLPSVEELRGKLLGCIASPLTGLVMAVSSQQRSLVNVLDQYAKQKEKQA